MDILLRVIALRITGHCFHSCLAYNICVLLVVPHKVMFDSGTEINRKAGFIVPTFYRPNPFAENLGCEIQDNGQIVTDNFNRTTQGNIYVAGEVAQSAPSSLMIAAAEGNKAAVAVNVDITESTF